MLGGGWIADDDVVQVSSVCRLPHNIDIHLVWIAVFQGVYILLHLLVAVFIHRLYYGIREAAVVIVGRA